MPDTHGMLSSPVRVGTEFRGKNVEKKEKNDELMLAKITEIPIGGLAKLFEVTCSKVYKFRRNSFACP
jgi:hypothetical protein